MVTSADDLLRQAQASTYEATRALNTERYGRAIAARQAYHAYTAAWPSIARAHLHLLDAAPLHGTGRPDLHRVRRGPGSDRRRRIVRAGSADPDPALLRVAELTAAAGDALQCRPRRKRHPTAGVGHGRPGVRQPEPPGADHHGVRRAVRSGPVGT